MKLVAVTRVRNEDDIIESFVRHHAKLVDEHVFLDNESNDGALQIVRSLRAEGLPVEINSTASGAFSEAAQNTLLLRRAMMLGADWVVFLDCDEFLDPRPLRGSLRDVLASLPEQAPCAHMSAVNYHPTNEDDRNQLIVPRRLTVRDAEAGSFLKVIVRARAAALGATISAGNHDACLRGTKLPAYQDPRLVIAHYYMRSGWQIIAKAFVGIMKTYAAGREAIEQKAAIHYFHIFENLRDHPEWLLNDHDFLAGTRPISFYGSVVADPIGYLGGELRYTRAGDAHLKAVRSMLACAEVVARRHGELADATAATRRMVNEWGSDLRSLSRQRDAIAQNPNI